MEAGTHTLVPVVAASTHVPTQPLFTHVCTQWLRQPGVPTQARVCLLESLALVHSVSRLVSPWAYVEVNLRSSCVQTRMDMHKCRWMGVCDSEEGAYM